MPARGRLQTEKEDVRKCACICHMLCKIADRLTGPFHIFSIQFQNKDGYH